MPRSSPYTLLWSEDHQQYEVHLRGQLQLRFPPGENEAFSRWLREQTSFAFAGRAGWLSVIKEARAAGAGYWYAYRTQDRRTRKRYLGSTAKVTFSRLEKAASELAQTPASNEPARPTARQQQKTFLSVKLVPPRVPHVLVDRPRLLRDLDTACTCPLTLVSASAGSGKTTLLATWVNETAQRLARTGQTDGSERGERDRAVTWLSLDEMDTDPHRFWASCIAALQTRLPAVGQDAFTLLHTPQAPPLAMILTMLLNELREERQKVILILDDYHVIENQAIAESMLFFLEHLPSTLHLVIATRADPELPLAHWRVRGQLIEIRDRDLRFSREEAASFLRQVLEHPLTEEEIVILQRHTEGWIAGLQLAALSLSRREDVSTWVSDFGGSHRFVLDYVQQDVLAGLPDALQHFLLQTSILTRMNAAACRAVMADSDLASSQHLLEEVERANLFVVPLDDARHWYRYHDLFREALLAALHTTQPELVPLLHRRAARFYEAEGQWAEAITHWLAAADFSTAARLMEQTVEHFWARGEAAMMARWALALPERLVREHARLALTIALYLLNTVPYTTGEQRARVYPQVRQLIARVEASLLLPQTDEISPSREAIRAGAALAFPSGNECFAAEEALLQRRLRLLHLQMVFFEALASWDVERMSALHQEMEELDQDEEIIWHMLPLGCSFVFHYSIRQEGAVLVPRLLEAKQRVSQSGNPFATNRVMQWLAMAAVEAGQLRLAYQESLAALALIERIKGYALLKGYFELVLAWVLYQWNRLEEARGRLPSVIQDAATWQQSDLLLSGYILLMQVELARGDLAAVQQALQGFEQLEAYQGYAHHWRWVPAIRVQWWLARGQVTKASDWAAGVAFPQDAWDGSLDAAFPVVIRVYFAQHRFREALDLLECWRGHLDRPTNIEVTISYLAQSLVALHQVGKSEQAHVIAARLFALTEPEGYIRLYLDQGEPMKEALLGWLTSDSRQPPQVSPTTAYVSRLLAAFEQEANDTSIPLETATLPSCVLLSSPVAFAPGASLTRQERRVLRLLVAGQTYAEMAQALVVSPNTIKSQVSSIYRKLDARNRLEAAAAAQRLHLL